MTVAAIGRSTGRTSRTPWIRLRRLAQGQGTRGATEAAPGSQVGPGTKSLVRVTLGLGRTKNNNLRRLATGAVLATRAGMPSANDRRAHRVETLVGRSLAICVNPYAAWRSRSTNNRALLLLAYFTVSYLLVFGLLRLASV